MSKTKGDSKAIPKYDGDDDVDDNKKDENEKKPEEELEDLGGMLRISSEYGRGHRCHLFLGILGATANGCTFPLFGFLFHEITNTLFYSDDLVADSLTVMFYFIAVGVGSFIFTMMQYIFWGYYGSHIGVSVRKDYFWSLMQQEVAYHDLRNSGTLNTEMIADCLFITEGMGIKAGFLIQQLVAFLMGFFLAFWYSWEMSLILLACLPAIVIVGLIQGKLFAGSGEDSDPFVNAGSFSNEVLVNIRSVVSSPSLLISKIDEYKSSLDGAFPIARKRATVIGFGIGAVLFCMFGVMYSIGLWYGSKLVDDGTIDIGDMFGCYFCFMISGMSLGQLGSVGEDIKKCQLGASRLFNLKARKPKIRSPDLQVKVIGGGDDKETVQHISGSIEFKNISFSYPSAPETIVIDNISFNIESGKTLAIVGPSGSGKSTIISLMERFYDPRNGEINIDNVHIHNYNLNYLRKQIGYVSQLPLLFAESISENIRGGLSNITQEDIERAAKFADADDFIMKLPQKYETNCGEMGNRLSGGQKQRIAIARAIVNNPSILLLDEATSALDTKSEREVQKAIDNISSSKQQTIIVIAHRLSTIKNADKILVIVDGEIEESGNHKELVNKNGVYSALVRSQQLVEKQSNDNNLLYGDDDDNKHEEEEEGNKTTTTTQQPIVSTIDDNDDDEAPPAYEENPVNDDDGNGDDVDANNDDDENNNNYEE